MSQLQHTLANLAPGVSHCRDLPGNYNPRHGLAIYLLPLPGYLPSAPGVALGEALAARSGLGCTLLEGIPEKIPEGAVVVGHYGDLKAKRPDLLEEIPDLKENGQYAIKLARSAIVTSPSREGLSAGMQTMAMLVLRHNENSLPASIIVDSPLCHMRCLTIELRSTEIGINLLMQIVSFAATFKANGLQFILDDDFDPAREIAGIETFVQTCQSYGITVGVRIPWLRRLLAREKTLLAGWSGLRSAARAFGATQVALDDPCPEDATPEQIMRVANSIVKGEVGLANVSVDANLLVKSGVAPSELKALGITGWIRVKDDFFEIPPEMDAMPLRLDVQAPLPGFSAADFDSYLRRLDAATANLGNLSRRELMVSFRDIGVSHMWQNMLYPAATGLIAAWGNPPEAAECAKIFTHLLYGDSAATIMEMWNTINTAFPSGLTPEEETIVRRTAFGAWPDTERERDLMLGIDWLQVAKNIRNAAESLKNAAAGLTRNAATLSGAKLSLHAMSWLHCFVALTPELERRRRLHYDDDGRTEPIATELYNNFQVWQSHLETLHQESGLEIGEMPKIESMGHRLKGLCEGIFE